MQLIHHRKINVTPLLPLTQSMDSRRRTRASHMNITVDPVCKMDCMSLFYINLIFISIKSTDLIRQHHLAKIPGYEIATDTVSNDNNNNNNLYFVLETWD